MSATPEDFTDVEETSRRLGIGKRRLRDGANHQGYPHHRFGNRLMFSAQDRAEIADMHRHGGRVARRTQRRPLARTAARAAA
ncbi:hypothetical protein ABIA32_002753 [Streptacidiphilus sp. MAP12-20]|uniref:hypothetical protein n=1 Tax=Streptacidiphilus sp. MAP12-20 TaxID=3156299 RepID=UPI003515219A